MKTKLIHHLSSIIRPVIRKACGIRSLRLHPKFRWLTYACPILDRTRSSRSSRFSVSNSALRVLSSPLHPPEAPPSLRLRKRRRVSVDTPQKTEP